MSDLRFTNFRPRWTRGLSEENLAARLDYEPFVGADLGPMPRIRTRILPSGRSGLSAKSLTEAIKATQELVSFAGNDAIRGFMPDFSDLRSLNQDVEEISRLSFEPFEEGSFVIVAKLSAEPLMSYGVRPRLVTTDIVADRFEEILTSLEDPERSLQVSVGALQSVERLRSVLRRDAEAVEFTALVRRASKAVAVDVNYVAKVTKLREDRLPTHAALESLEGVITALDLSSLRLQLTIPGQAKRVSGAFSILITPIVERCLGRRVRLQGEVRRGARGPKSIVVYDAETLDE